MDNLLLITLLLVFLTALIGAYVSRRSKERVLKDFDAYHVTIEREDGAWVWGCLKVYASGLELLYASPHRSGERMSIEKSSYILPAPHLASIRSIRRYHDELTPVKQKRRREDIDRTYNPGLLRRMRRSTRNFLNTFRDAINESIGLLLLRMKASSQSAVLQMQNQRLQRISEEALGTVNNAYDPILEHYIGRRVVIERQDSEVPEVAGILKEYSPDWLLVLDCHVPQEVGLALDALDRFRLQRNLDFSISLHASDAAVGNLVLDVTISNRGDDPVWIDRLEGTDYIHTVDRKLRPNESVDFTVTDLPASALEEVDTAALPLEWELVAPERAGPDQQLQKTVTDPGISDLELVIYADREVDLCLPRTRAVVRHSGERIV